MPTERPADQDMTYDLAAIKAAAEGARSRPYPWPIEFTARCDPATILALVAVVEAAQGMVSPIPDPPRHWWEFDRLIETLAPFGSEAGR